MLIHAFFKINQAFEGMRKKNKADYSPVASGDNDENSSGKHLKELSKNISTVQRSTVLPSVADIEKSIRSSAILCLMGNRSDVITQRSISPQIIVVTSHTNLTIKQSRPNAVNIIWRLPTLDC
jgi:hypothetical protein